MSNNIEQRFIGKYYKGRGDIRYIKLLDTARRMLEPDEELPNLTMFYKQEWNAFTLGDCWDAWWIQNTYGASYCAMPFLWEPFATFLQNSQDFWFDNMGDGKREGLWGGPEYKHLYGLVAPDGCLCDCAAPGRIAYKQGDTNVAYMNGEVLSTGYTDWGMEFTAAGIVLQGELLLVGRDLRKIARYLPLLERCANFIETRRHPENDLFLVGPGGNLLAPSYGGWKKKDGTVEDAYLAGLSITYIAALDRLIELEKMSGRHEQFEIYTKRREAARNGLRYLMTDEGYFIRSIDPDGTKHGVFGQDKYGYFELPPNHDAVCFRIADDDQVMRIFGKIDSIPELRPYVFTIPNYPAYDDLPDSPQEFLEYEGKYEGKSLMDYGIWVNGGHWSTCEARMIMAYYRAGKFEDARRSMEKQLTFIERFKMDAPMPGFGSEVWFKDRKVNMVYDCLGISNAFIRGLFEYIYTADGLRLIPHIPEGVTELEQSDPVRFGEKEVFIKVAGNGPVSSVKVNGSDWYEYDMESVFLPYGKLPDVVEVLIGLGGVEAEPENMGKAILLEKEQADEWGFIDNIADEIADIGDNGAKEIHRLFCRGRRLASLYREVGKLKIPGCYEMEHLKLAVDCVEMVYKRNKKLQAGGNVLLSEEVQKAVGEKYFKTAESMCIGIEKILDSCKVSAETYKIDLYELWEKKRTEM